MDIQQQEFEYRVKRLRRKRSKAMRSNAPAFIDQDGYVIVQAKSRARRVPFLGVFLLALGFFALKGLMIAGIGLLPVILLCSRLGNRRSDAPT